MTDTDHKTFGEALAAHAAERGDQVAIRFGDRATDYATLESQVNRVANGLTSEGIGPGDRVAYLGKNSDRAVALTLACGRVGAVFVPIIWRLGPSEIAYILEDAGATMLFVEPEFDAAPFDGPRIAMDDSFDSWRDEQDAADPDVEVTGADPFLQLYTSGTTGRPKGVVLSHRNGTNMRVRLREEGIYWYAADPGDSVILAMPLRPYRRRRHRDRRGAGGAGADRPCRVRSRADDRRRRALPRQMAVLGARRAPDHARASRGGERGFLQRARADLRRQPDPARPAARGGRAAGLRLRPALAG